MNISPQGIALIKQFEGFSAQAYLCPAGKWTIGYGHVIPALRGDLEPTGVSSDPRSGAGMTEQEATQLLLQDLAPVEAAINRLVKVPLTQNQFDALCSLIYNIGIGAFAKSTLLKLLNRHCEECNDDAIHREAGLPRRSDDLLAMTANQFSRWVYGDGKVLAGLVARRKAEAALFVSP